MIVTISYTIAALVYLVFFVVLLTDKHRGRNKTLLVSAALLSFVWASSIVAAQAGHASILLTQFAEVIKTLGWIALVMSMLMSAGVENISLSQRLGVVFRNVFLILAILTVILFALVNVEYIQLETSALIAVHLMLSVAGIVMVEQLYRNFAEAQRWVIKYLCLGLLGSFVYSFYMYSDAMLYQRVDPVLWQVRGFIEAAMLPLIAYSVSRDPLWSPEIFLSRRVVFHTTTLLASAVYLFIMGVAGYYVKQYGGNWGAVIQAFLLFMTIIVLAVFLMSRRIRAKLRVFVNKHFYPYKYDYRDEWLRLIRTISMGSDNLFRQSIKAIAQIIESPGGQLWLYNGHGFFECVEADGMPLINEKVPSEASLPRFIREYEFVINVDEFKEQPEVYTRLGALELPGWVDHSGAWLIVPLINIDQLIGFIVLDSSAEHKKHFNWEDSDLLKTAARQVASYIAQQKTSDALAEAKQFESFNKISTYIVHDIKNLVAQLSLIVSNADKHKHNPLFVEDALRTIDNTVKKMNKMMDVVTNKSASQSNKVNIIELLDELVRNREQSRQMPIPVLGCESREVYVKADHDQLMSIFGHIVQNAQDATADDGEIKITQTRDGDKVVIKFADTGCGMSEDFIKNHLFKPFKSTKGKGMGIGVYETREIISALGGTVEVESQLKRGTVFTVSLPICR